MTAFRIPLLPALVFLFADRLDGAAVSGSSRFIITVADIDAFLVIHEVKIDARTGIDDVGVHIAASDVIVAEVLEGGSFLKSATQDLAVCPEGSPSPLRILPTATVPSLPGKPIHRQASILL